MTEDHQGKPLRGIRSNDVCDRKVGNKAKVVCPFGSSFLMPNHPKSRLVTIRISTGRAQCVR